METGTTIITLVDKNTTEGLEEVFIPKGTVGTVCEIHETFVLVEIWGEDAPPGVEGVFDFEPAEIKEI